MLLHLPNYQKFLLEFSHQKDCTGMNLTIALARHSTALEVLGEQEDKVC